MTELIIVVGVLSLLGGIIVLINPEVILGYLQRNIENPAIHVAAVVVRLAVGTLLIHQSDQSKYPLAIEILGWLAIAAALTMTMMGRRHFIGLMTWALNVLTSYGRVGGVLAAAFGGFLIYAYI